MTAPYATAEALRALYPSVADEPESRVSAVLRLASAAIGGACDASAVDADVLELVCCRVAQRMLASPDGAAVKQESWGASPLSGSVTYDVPSGDVYLTSFERRLLGIDGSDCAVTVANWGGASDARADG